MNVHVVMGGESTHKYVKCMRACIYKHMLCLCLYVYTCVHVYIYIYIHTHLEMFMLAYMCIHR